MSYTVLCEGDYDLLKGLVASRFVIPGTYVGIISYSDFSFDPLQFS